MSRLSSDQIKALLVNAGFKVNSNDTASMVGIAYAESGGDPTKHNDNPKTGDESYGLWQINMIGKLGPDRRKKFGISTNAQLFDPATNAKAAYIVYKESGLDAWTTYTSGKYLNYMDGTTGFEDGKDTESSQPTSDLAGLNSIGENIFKSVSNIGGIIVAVALLVLGVVILSRNVIPAGKVVKAVKKVAS